MSPKRSHLICTILVFCHSLAQCGHLVCLKTWERQHHNNIFQNEQGHLKECPYSKTNFDPKLSAKQDCRKNKPQIFSAGFSDCRQPSKRTQSGRQQRKSYSPFSTSLNYWSSLRNTSVNVFQDGKLSCLWIEGPDTKMLQEIEKEKNNNDEYGILAVKGQSSRAKYVFSVSY